ncbi:excalibur calcium-binding domain-containing protein [Microgenomates group bacterium]|nr:excalibur calcium-binding domain-containing protein [Microgenomates group bacterium]
MAALSFVWMASFLTTPDRPKQEEGQQEIVQELEEVEATPVPTPEPTPTPTPEPTPTPTPVPTPTPTPQPTPTPKPTPAPVSPAPAVETPPASQTNVAPPAATCPKNCTEARAMGMTNMTRDHECYRSSLDRDNDGIACDK